MLNYLATMEIGKRTPSLRTLARLDQALGVSISDLVAIEGEKNKLDLADFISRSLGNLDKDQSEFVLTVAQFLERCFRTTT
ncbi:MAG TPA: helix-turn-helix transcriptional regulator [Armatimonadota bacterium]|nr:helix-turn-helix transcriptional regulator [Armatimonadota bacterium]